MKNNINNRNKITDMPFHQEMYLHDPWQEELESEEKPDYQGEEPL